MQQEIEKKVMETTRRIEKTITEDSGVEPTLSEEELRQHLELALE